MKTPAFHMVPTQETESLLTPAQKTFNRLRAKIKALQEKYRAVTQELDASLQFYYAKIRPEEVAFQDALLERIKITYQFYKSQKSLSKANLKSLKASIKEYRAMNDFRSASF